MAIPAFAKVREESLHKTMQNDARQIAAAAQQYMLENGEKPVAFHIDPQTGLVSGPISVYVLHVTRGTREIDGTIENAHDDFSLQNPNVRRGKPVVFDAEGHER
jgi:type IV pilus assembly protein PilA